MQRRWQDGCRIWPLLARGLGTLYLVPGAGCTTAYWTCQALIHQHVKLPKTTMARKNKRQQLRKPQRGSAGARAARPAGMPPVAPTSTGQTTPAASGATSAVPAQRPLPRPVRGRPGVGPLTSEDAAIPLERVPYFRSDLRRIALTAGLMFVLLVVGSFVLRGVLQA